MKQCLAYIDDNAENLDCMRLMLVSDYDVKTFQNPFEFIDNLKPNQYSAILLDIHMPVLDGFSLYEKILEKEGYDGCPIIFISSDNSDACRIKSFSLGAVDFLDRHSSALEVTSRLASQIMFFQKHKRVLELGNIKLNLTLLKAYLNEKEVRLTFIEFKLLNFLIKAYPNSNTREELAEAVWSDTKVLDATIYTHTFNLNSKIEDWEYEVVSERGKGIKLLQKSSL